MAHQLTLLVNGKAEMAYAGDTPWHGLGQKLKKGAAIEEWRIAAGMDWKVQRSKVRYYAERDGSRQLEWPDYNVLFRSDSKAPLGIVSSKFKVVQPQDTLEFFRDVLEGFPLETAGTLYGGRRFWALASIGESARMISPQDVVGGFLLVCTAVDGTLETTVRDTTVCVVCNNTLSAALSVSAKREVKVSHRSHFDANKVKAQLGITRDNFSNFMASMRQLAALRLPPASADDLTCELLVPAGIDRSELSKVDRAVLSDKTRSSKNYQSIMGLFGGKGLGSNLAGRAGTAWGWVNAVTEHIDYRAKTLTVDNRLDSAWFGRGDALKTRAVELACRLG